MLPDVTPTTVQFVSERLFKRLRNPRRVSTLLDISQHDRRSLQNVDDLLLVCEYAVESWSRRKPSEC